MRKCSFSLKLLACVAMLAISFCGGCESQPAEKVEPAVLEPAPAVPVETEAAESASEVVAEPESPEPIPEVVTEPEVPEPVLAEPKLPSETIDTGVAVTINGVDITEEQLREMMQPELDKLAERGKKMPKGFIERYKLGIRDRTLQAAITSQLVEQQIKAKNVEITDEELISKIEEIASMQNPPMSLEEFKSRVESSGVDFDQAKQQFREILLQQKLIDAEYGDIVNPTEEDAQKYYSENSDRFKMPEQVKASHILIKADTSDPNADPNQVKAEAKSKAQGLLEQIRSGANFAELAQANSDCPSAEKGGDLGLFGKGRMVPAFEEAAFALQVGQVSDLVETQYGYHIITLTDHKEASVIPFEEAKENILNMLIQTEQRKRTREYMNSLREKADIVYPPGKEPKKRAPLYDSSKKAAPAPKTPAEPQDSGETAKEESPTTE